MTELRLRWEPEGTTAFSVTSEQISKYTDRQVSFAQFPAGTCLFLKPGIDLDVVVPGAMREARMKTDFHVSLMEDGDYAVMFANPLRVHVGKEEFTSLRKQIVERESDLLFPGEVFGGNNITGDTRLVGIYARGKLQRAS